MPSLRILIADDHPLFRKGMRTLLEAMPETTVVGEATNGREVVEMAVALQPDVVLMDLQMPGSSGLAATRAITDCCPDVRILVVTLFEDDDSVFSALRAGARGYILKDAGEEEIMLAIRAVGKGDAIFSPTIAALMMDYFAVAGDALPQAAFPELTPREREILRLIARGQTNAAIAAQLVISLKTVRNHVANIYNKLQVADRTQAAIRAREAGLS